LWLPSRCYIKIPTEHEAPCTSAVIEAVYERGCETIVLHVAATNAPARAPG
jgi:hypothetical protein